MQVSTTKGKRLRCRLRSLKFEFINTTTGEAVVPLFDTPASFKFTHLVEVGQTYEAHINIYDAATNELLIQHPIGLYGIFKTGGGGNGKF